MEITDELIDHLAVLSRLEFTDEEKQSFKKDFSNIINYVDMLSGVDDCGTKINKLSLNAKYDLREDEIKEGLNLKQITLNAPKSMGGAIVVPTVVEEE